MNPKNCHGERSLPRLTPEEIKSAHLRNFRSRVNDLNMKVIALKTQVKEEGFESEKTARSFKFIDLHFEKIRKEIDKELYKGIKNV